MNKSIIRVLLINPDYPDVYTFGPQKSMMLPPLGLEYIASYISDIADVLILDKRLKCINLKEIEKKIKWFQPDFIGISCNYSSQIDNVLRIAKVAKNLGNTVVVGGWHPTLIPEEVLETDSIDIVVRGEGELTFRELIQNKNPINISGLSYKQDGKIIHNPDRELMDLKHILIPNRRTRSKEAKKNYGFMGLPVELIETSRGCPYECTFCCIHYFFRKTHRQRSVKDIIKELQSSEIKNRAGFIFIIDDNFLVNRKFVLELCDAIIQHGIKKYFITQVRVDMVLKYPEVFQKMAEAGFILLFLGLESFSDRTLEKLNKRINFQEIKLALGILNNLGFYVQGNIIIGADLEDTIEDLESTIEIGKTLKIDIPTFSLLTPFPGTKLMEQVLKEDLLLTRNWRHFNWSYPVIKYPHLSSDDLNYYLNKAYKEILYSKNSWQAIRRIFRARGLKFHMLRIASISMFKGIPLMINLLSNLISDKLRD